MKLNPKMVNDSGRPSFLNRLNRFMWAKLSNFEVIINVPDSDDGTHQRIMLTFSRPYGHFTLDLTSLSEIEFSAFRETILIATDLAQPLVEQLDQKARDDELDGNDTNPRLYRSLPVVVVRKGAVRKYSPGILLGRKDILQGIGTRFPAAGPASPGGLEVDDPDETNSVSSDNAAQVSSSD